MAYENDVRRQMRLLDDAVRNAGNERRKVGPFVESTHQWWKGKGGESFIKEYKNIDSDVSRLLRSIENAVNNMNRLSALIERAELERKEEIAKLTTGNR